MIGVLGGMGPLATVDFLAKVIAATPATCDQQHVPMIVHQVPQIPDRSTAILEGNNAPLAPMLAGLERLARAGAEVVAIPCNTAHHWYEPLTRLQRLPICTLLKRRGRSCRAADPAVVVSRFSRPGARIGRVLQKPVGRAVRAAGH